MSRLLMANRVDPFEGRVEAEPVVLAIEGGVLGLTLDDGLELAFDLREFVRAIDGERAPGESRAA